MCPYRLNHRGEAYRTFAVVYRDDEPVPELPPLREGFVRRITDAGIVGGVASIEYADFAQAVNVPALFR